jgi:hypothetical protein
MTTSEENLIKYRIKETFNVDFYIEAPSYAVAKDKYNKMFDKNIQLGYDTWKELADKHIRNGKFYVQAQDNEVITTVIDELWGEEE